MDYLLDIGIPCFNDDKYLRRCVQSIADCFRGDYNKIQIWIIDDDSMYSEGYLKIIEDFNYLNFIYIKNEVNSGPGQSRNKVFEMGQSEWITFIDDDDIFIKNPLCFIDELNKNSDIIFFDTLHSSGKKWYKAEDTLRGITGILIKSNFIKTNNIKFPSELKFTGEDTFMCLLFKSISLNIDIIKDYYCFRPERDKTTEEITNFSFYELQDPIKQLIDDLTTFNYFLLIFKYKEKIINYKELVLLINSYVNSFIYIIDVLKEKNLIINYYYFLQNFLWVFYLFVNLLNQNNIELQFNEITNALIKNLNKKFYIKNNNIYKKDNNSLAFNVNNYYHSFLNNYYLKYVQSNRKKRKLPQKYQIELIGGFYE